jgi:hypothetical protein
VTTPAWLSQSNHSAPSVFHGPGDGSFSFVEGVADALASTPVVVGAAQSARPVERPHRDQRHDAVAA